MPPARRTLVLPLALALFLPSNPLAAQDSGPAIATVPANTPHDDQRRTVRSYHRNLWHNLKHVVPDNPGPLLIGAGFTGASLLLDDEVIGYFERHPSETFADVGATLGGSVVVTGLTLGFFSAGRIARGGRFRAATYDVSQAILVNFVYTYAAKAAAGRQRPVGTSQHSFPSGHASNAFAGATAIAHHYGIKLAVPGYALATYIGASRLAGAHHHLSDVVAGAALGVSVGRTVVKRNGRAVDPPSEAGARFELLPDAGPAGDGAGLRLVVVF